MDISMNLYINDAEERLKSALLSYEKANDAIGLYFALSKLPHKKDSNDPKTIALNILRDQFKGAAGDIYVLTTSDVIVVYRGRNEALIQECSYNMQYLFAEEGDQLAFTGALTPQYTRVFHPKEWEGFLNLCYTLLENINGRNAVSSNGFKGSMLTLFGTIIEDVLATAQWSTLIRSSAVYKIADSKQHSKVLDELYVDIGALTYLVGDNLDIILNPYLKNYFKEFLDIKLLIKLVHILSKSSGDNAYLLHLNISTVSSSEFEQLAVSLPESTRKRIIISIAIGDIFLDFAYFLQVREQLAAYGFKLCLDNLDYLSFMQIDRSSLGFDLVRIKHSEMFDVIRLSELEEQLRNKINISGSSRVILEAPNTESVAVGRKLGLMLFQIDKS